MKTTKTVALRFGRTLGINLLIATAFSTAVFAVHVNTDHHTDPTISRHMVAPTWQN